MDDPYEWREHKARLADTSVLLLIYAVLLAILVLIEPLPRRDRAAGENVVLLSLQSNHPAFAQRKFGEDRNDNRIDRLVDGPADAHCDRQRLPARTLLPCDHGG